MAYYLQVYLALFRYNELHTMIFGNKNINDNLNMYINDHLRMYTSDYALI